MAYNHINPNPKLRLFYPHFDKGWLSNAIK